MRSARVVHSCYKPWSRVRDDVNTDWAHRRKAGRLGARTPELRDLHGGPQVAVEGVSGTLHETRVEHPRSAPPSSRMQYHLKGLTPLERTPERLFPPLDVLGMHQGLHVRRVGEPVSASHARTAHAVL